MNIPRLFEMTRLTGISAGIFFSYLAGNGDAPTTLHYLSVVVPVIMGGLTGIEGMFFGNAASKAIGREADPRYQKQSGGANLSLALTAIIVFFCRWGLFAEATILIATLMFFVLSAAVHTWEIFAMKNRSAKNALRPMLTLALLGASLWPLIASF